MGAEHFSLPPRWKAPAGAVDPRLPQQIRARRWARPGRPPPPTGRRGPRGGDSGRVAARKGLARGGSGRGAGAAPPISRPARAEGRGVGRGAREPTLAPTLPAPGAHTWLSPRNLCGGGPAFEHSGLNRKSQLTPPNFSFTWKTSGPSSGWRPNLQSSHIAAPKTAAGVEARPRCPPISADPASTSSRGLTSQKVPKGARVWRS